MCEDSAFCEGHGAEHASAKHLQVFSVQNTRNISMTSAHPLKTKAGTSLCPGSSRRNRAMERFVASFVRKDRVARISFVRKFFVRNLSVVTLTTLTACWYASNNVKDFRQH